MADLTREEVVDQLMYHANNKYHICEVLRLIYDRVHAMPETVEKSEMTELLIDAMGMAKKMQDRLAYYQKTYGDNTGNKASGIVGLVGVSARARMRHERKIFNDSL